MKRGSKANRRFDVVLGTPLLNVLATLRRRRSVPVEPPRTIGVMCSPALGDTLLFSAVLQDIRARWPRARIVHFCMQANLAAAKIIPGADELVTISLTAPHRSIAQMRSVRVDVLFDFTAWQRVTALYTLMSGARYTVGFRAPGQRRSRGYDRAVPHRNDLHELDNFRALLDGSGLSAASDQPVGGSPHHAPAVAVPPLAAPLFDGEADLVVFHLWASGQRSWLREWPDDRWVELARRLARPEDGGPGTLFLLTAAPGDRPRADPFAARLREAGLRAGVYVSPDGFRTLVHLLRRARLVVSVNTSVMHLAAIVGAPTVSLNGPTAEHRWGARGPCVRNVQPADGSGGYLHFGFEFDGQPEDVIARITVDQVVEACVSLEQCAGSPDRLATACLIPALPNEAHA